ncbi:MAG: SDR family NAD(P)-dependent oxidoreductase [Spirochaetaceae bacterium]|nr:MAG: SDR family NAD(P)-dependent oxidoreductase [Spirochaetaceae bacterium]
MSLSFCGRLVVVTGASSGLGRAIAIELAVREDADVVAVARRADRLTALCREIEATSQSRAWPCPVDLAADEGVAALRERVAEIVRARDAERTTDDPRNRGVFAIVNNAGVTWYGLASGMRPDDVRRVVALNLRAPIDLTIAYARDFAARESADACDTHASREPLGACAPLGAILNVTSIGAFVPVPYQSVYAATKHGLHAFTESIASERWAERIVFTAAAPGGIATEMAELAGLEARFDLDSSVFAPADRVASQIVRAWKQRRRSYTPGLSNRLLVAGSRLLPRRLVARLAARTYEPPEHGAT